jgi:peptidyl-Asp metalloendopeptidase
VPIRAEKIMLISAWRRLAFLFAASLALCAIAPPARTQTGAEGENLERTHEPVIIVDKPTRKSRVHALLSRFARKAQSLAVTGAEVWSIPKSEASQLLHRLEGLGRKAIKLEEDWQQILVRPKGPVSLAPRQQAVVNKVGGLAETVNVNVLKMPHAAVVEHAMAHSDARVVLPLGEGKTITIVRTQPTVKTDKGSSWRGETEGTGEQAALMLWKDGHLSGYFGYNGHIYTISHMGGGIHAVAEMDPGKLPPDHPAMPQSKSADASVGTTTPLPVLTEPPVAPFSDAERNALEAKKITIDVMILYTRNAAKHYVRDPADILFHAIEDANKSFRDSGLGNITLRLVHTQAIDYDGSRDDHFNHLYRMVDGIGPFKEVNRLRNEKRADIVGLVIDNPNGCGLSTRVGPDSEDAFFVVHHSCALINYSIAHEIGHILGARHDRRVDPTITPYPYAHGYVSGTAWRSLMSYNDACGGCPRIPHWSNPRVMYKGQPTGTPSNDAARVILQEAERVSKFR